jgi:hypothetical protein
MFRLEKGDFVRIERSPLFNGHFYFRCKRQTDTTTMTIGFGYDEPYRRYKDNPWLSNSFVHMTEMLYCVIDPPINNWIVYHNDFPRNLKTPFVNLFNYYHIVTDWIPLSDVSVYDLNNVIMNNGHGEHHFVKGFSPISSNEVNNCRSILLSFLKDSLTINGYNLLSLYLIGNPLSIDLESGCVYFSTDNGELSIMSSHHCLFVWNNSCCVVVDNVINKAIRHPFLSASQSVE